MGIFFPQYFRDSCFCQAYCTDSAENRGVYMQTQSHIGLISMLWIVIQSTEAKLSPTLWETNKSAALKFIDKHWGEKGHRAQSDTPSITNRAWENSWGCQIMAFGVMLQDSWGESLPCDVVGIDRKLLSVLTSIKRHTDKQAQTIYFLQMTRISMVHFLGSSCGYVKSLTFNEREMAGKVEGKVPCSCFQTNN